jgi:outer membrane beta-barrel protein
MRFYLLPQEETMRKTCLLLLTAVIAIAVAVPALAEVRSGGFTVSPYVGGFTFDGVEHAQTNVSSGLRLGYNLTRNWGIEAQGGFVPLETTKAKGPHSAFYNVRLDLLYHFMPEKRFVPFVALGEGWTREQYNRDDDIFAEYGLGALYFVTDNLALRGDLRHLIIIGDNDTKGSNFKSNYEYTVGLSYQIGGSKAAAKVVAEPVPAPAPAPVPAPVPAPAPAPAPAPEQPSSWQGAPTAVPAGAIMVNGMKVEDNILEFTASEAIKNYKVLTLSQPSRLVIDVANAVNGLGTGSITVNKLGVTTVRFESSPEYLRIILDAEEGRLIPYRIEETATGFKVIITTP